MEADHLWNWPVLLTGTIVQHPEAQAVLIEPQERERQYLSVLSQMATARNSVKAVIFCENSSARLDSFYSLIGSYERNHRTFQIYKVPMPDNCPFSGKGWGEGIIIRWALDNIAVLSQSKGFMKITGRYNVHNLKRIVTIIKRGLRNNPNIKFICQGISNASNLQVETRFFWADTVFYRKHMLDVYCDVKDENGIFLEHVIANRLIQLMNRYEFAVLPIPLLLQGVSGWNAREVMSIRSIMKQELKQLISPLPQLLSFKDACNSLGVFE